MVKRGLNILGIFLIGLLGGIIGSLLVSEFQSFRVSEFFNSQTLKTPQLSNSSIAEAENITLTTYYPSPYGVYDGLVAYRLGIGDTTAPVGINNADVPASQGDLKMAGVFTQRGISTDPNATAVGEGRIYYDSDSSTFQISNDGGTSYATLATTALLSDDWDVSGIDIYNNNAGNVGIGTAGAAAEKLTVNGNIQALGNIFFQEGQNGVLGFNYPDVTYDRRLRITAGLSDTADNDQAASIDLHGVNNGGSLDLVAGRNSIITFWTSPALTNASERARITENGNVGIGTAPNELLTVEDAISLGEMSTAPTDPLTSPPVLQTNGYGKIFAAQFYNPLNPADPENGRTHLYFMSGDGTVRDLIYGYFAPS